MFCILNVIGTMALSATAPSVETLKLFYGMNLARSAAPAMMQRLASFYKFI